MTIVELMYQFLSNSGLHLYTGSKHPSCLIHLFKNYIFCRLAEPNPN